MKSHLVEMPLQIRFYYYYYYYYYFTSMKKMNDTCIVYLYLEKCFFKARLNLSVSSANGLARVYDLGFYVERWIV